jgi:hypothetical protein
MMVHSSLSMMPLRAKYLVNFTGWHKCERVYDGLIVLVKLSSLVANFMDIFSYSFKNLCIII